MNSLQSSLLFAALAFAGPAFAGNTVPAASGTALDGHTVVLPRDLSGHATVLILGFSQHSKDNTTAWEVPVRTQLASAPAIGFYDMPFLEDAPALIRPVIVRAIKGQVPDILKPNFVPLTSGQNAWKQAAGFTPSAADAAYIILVDKSGTIRWQTHEPYSPALFAQLSAAARTLATEGK